MCIRDRIRNCVVRYGTGNIAEGPAMTREECVPVSYTHLTRAAICMERGAALGKEVIFAVGNAPTALIRLYELIQEGKVDPALIIGAPVGFVNVVEAKELIMTAGVPYIVPRGRKGGSNIAATICNAMLYYKG